MQVNSMDMNYYRMVEFSIPFIMISLDGLEESFVLLFLQVHLLTDVTVVHATVRSVALLKHHMYRNFNIPSIKL